MALTTLLAQEGRGAQTRLATEQGIDRGYFNAIVKGSKSGADDVRVKIANHFGMTFEDMLALGRRIVEEGGEDDTSEIDGNDLTTGGCSQSSGMENESLDFKSTSKNEELAVDLSDKVIKVLEILDSGAEYSEVLGGMIEMFHDALQTKAENLTLRNRVTQLESRMETLEKRLNLRKKYIEKLA